jgi:hypothetical protein
VNYGGKELVMVFHHLYSLKPFVRVKVKLSRVRHAVTKWERNYRSYSFSSSALDGFSDKHHASAMLYPLERTLIPIGWTI